MNYENLQTIKEDAYRCSKCGLCQCVCPLYLASKNEMFLSRGRYIVINNFFNNKKELSKDFVQNTDVCLNCNLCKNFCPSDIDAVKINTAIKSSCGYKYSFVKFSTIYKLLLFLHSAGAFVYKFLPFKSLFLNSYLDRLFDVKIKRKTFKPALIKAKVAFFEGCFNKYVNPSDKNAALNILEKAGFDVAKIVSNCCGYPYYQEGNLTAFEKNALKINNSIPQNVFYIVVTCDSCYEMLSKVLDSNNKSKLIRLDELLEKESYAMAKGENTLYFKPLLRTNEAYLPECSQKLFKKGICSLNENFFSFKYKKLAKQIMQTTFPAAGETSNKIIYTTCLLSKWGLLKEIIYTKSNAQVYSYAEYLEISDSYNG